MRKLNPENVSVSVWRSTLSFHQQIPSATKSEPENSVRKGVMV